MGDVARALDFLEEHLAGYIRLGVIQLTAGDAPLDGRFVEIGGKRKLNFASCSYLGLELDPRLKQGAIEAVERYGTQFSSSRTYVSAPLYEELEALLEQISGAPTLVTPNTTLAHLSALPAIVGEDDAVLLDQHVHHTVQLASPILRQQGTRVELLRHGRVDLLEARLAELAGSHPRVWYVVDGVFSMFGDLAPMKALAWLLERFEQLHLYVDDAHGMSWTGERGRGFALEQIPRHERMVVATSLNKAFAAAGGALVFPNEALKRRVRICGGPMIFTGPIQPPMLGAAVASARVHLSDEMPRLQAELLERIRCANRVAAELGLPLVSSAEVPIRFVGVGVDPALRDMASFLLERGYLANAAGFPAVSSRHCGIRFTVTRHQTQADLRALLEAMAERLPHSLAEAGLAREELDRGFRLGAFSRRGPAPRPAPEPAQAGALVCEHATSIRAVDAAEWDAVLGGRGTFDAAGLRLLEEVFSGGPRPEERWDFHYYAVRSADGRPLLATFATEALWKDDLLAAAAVSQAVEERRVRDPYFLTSRLLALGCFLSEGNHLYLDRSGDWRGALRAFLDAALALREARGVPALVLRDLPAEDAELGEFLKDQGFLRLPLPDALVLEVSWRNQQEFLSKLTKRGRRFQREQVEAFDAAFELEVLTRGGRRPPAEEWRHLYDLYLGVKQRNLALNTFALPPALFPRMLDFDGWELLLLRLRPEHGGSAGALPQGFMACFAGTEHYVPVVAGMDYRLVESHGLYRQLLAQTVRRAHARGARRVHFGMGAELEKSRFGARREERVMYVLSQDTYHHELLALVAAEANQRRS